MLPGTFNPIVSSALVFDVSFTMTAGSSGNDVGYNQFNASYGSISDLTPGYTLDLCFTDSTANGLEFQFSGSIASQLNNSELFIDGVSQGTYSWIQFLGDTFIGGTASFTFKFIDGNTYEIGLVFA